MILNNFAAMILAISFAFFCDPATIHPMRVELSHGEVIFEVEAAEIEASQNKKEAEEIEEECPPAVTTPQAFKREGVRKWNGWRWTWYSERVLPGGGLDIPGRHTDEDGFVCDEDGYIVLASEVLEKGTVIDTIFGRKGKIYDCGCDDDIIDVYVNW